METTNTTSVEMPVIAPVTENAVLDGESTGARAAPQPVSTSAEPQQPMTPFGFITSEANLSLNTAPLNTLSHGTPHLSPHYDISQIKRLLKHQIEYYFSRDNLNHDPYLVSQMDSDQYVDISIIANFNQVRKLTSDQSLIVEVLRDSPFVQVDETEQKIRPLHKRSVLILRELPEGTTQQEIEEIFTHSDCPSFVSCEYASGNCWYVNFDTEEQAQDAFRYIRETLQTFKGQRIMARIKAKPSAPSAPAVRSDQQRLDGGVGQLPSPAIPAVPLDSIRAQVPTLPLGPSTTPSTIRYPVPLHHFPLQSPQAPTPFQFPPQYMQYLVPQALIQQQWNFPADPNFAHPYDFSNYSYPIMSPQPRPVTSNPSRGQGDRRVHSLGSSGGSSDRLVESVPSATLTSSTNTAPKNSAMSHSNYYNNSRSHSNHGDSPSFYKQGEKISNRGRYSGNQSTHDHHYNNADNIPPRHRAQHKQRQSHNSHSGGGGGGGSASSSQSHMSSGPSSRRPINRSGGSASANNAMNSNSHTGNANPLPHFHRDQRAFNSNTSQSAGNDSGSRNDQRSSSSRDYGRQGAAFDHQSVHNRNHGARRNSKSPEKDAEQHPMCDVLKSQSFELDSSAFPALPGAITAVSPTANTISLPHSDTVTVTTAAPTLVASTATTTTTTSTTTTTTSSSNHQTQATKTTNDNSQSTSTVLIESEKTNGNVETVSKLSDIVKSNIHDHMTAAKLSDIVKGVNKLSTSAQASSQKESAEKPSQKARGHSNKASSASANHKTRPTHLTNGTHTGPDTLATKNSGKAANAKSSLPSTKVPTETASSKPAAKAEPVPLVQTKRKNSGSDSASSDIVAANKSSQGQHSLPIDHKLSYAAMAQRVAATNTPPVNPKISPTQDTAPSTSAATSTAAGSSSGDNNNNADNKPTSKNDNLYSSTAAKNTAPTPSANGPTNGPSVTRKPQQQPPRNGPYKSKSNRPPTSPPSRTASTSHTTSSAVVA